MQEIWKDVVWYEWSYQVSNLGAIRSLDRRASYSWKFWTVSRTIKWRILSKVYNNWYYYVTIRHNNKSIMKSVHSLVADTFIGERPPLHEINHIDWDKSNNSYYNLEYCTRSENMKHAVNMWLLNFKNWAENKFSKRIRVYWNWINEVVYWAKQASNITWVDRSTISKKCRIPLKRKPYKNNNWYQFTYVS